ncbi:MAG: hypothetical protein IPP44_00460 [Ideonella sp.]|nr:hypothetical protein [Ideonella sp.]
MQSQLENALMGLRDLRQRDRALDLSSHIEAMLRQAWPDEESSVLRGELVEELHRHNRFAEAESLLISEVEHDPAEPYHSLALAEHFHYYDVDLAKGIRHIAQAIAKAKVDGKFMYQALGIQARLAIEDHNWHLLESTLHDLAAYEHTPGNADVFPETDFVPRIPVGVVSPDCIHAYASRVEYLRSVDYSTLHGVRRSNP